MEPTTSKKKIQKFKETSVSEKCIIHNNKKIKFICCLKNCLKELCSFCILDHKTHIDHISRMDIKINQIK